MEEIVKYPENILDPEDERLFILMKEKYISSEEKEFFERMHVKMLSELAASGELIVSEKQNPDGIYFLREQYDEFIVGQGHWGEEPEELHTMNLSDALNANLKEYGFMDTSMTLLEWLRNRNYQGVMYDHNYNYM